MSDNWKSGLFVPYLRQNEARHIVRQEHEDAGYSRHRR